jgi:hypothetical protein
VNPDDGIVRESWPGSGEIAPRNPVKSLDTNTWENDAGVGDVTVTVRVCPGLKMEPFAGEEI